jgi:crotonobetaine/carnitine-CoA ligase
MMAHGYLDRADDTIRNWRDLWIHTGDEGYLDDDGYLFFVGRMGHFLRRRGELVSVSEVEDVILGCPLVADVAVVGVPSEMGEDDILCAILWNDAAASDPEDLIAYCKEKMAAFKVPRYVRSLEAMPRTAAKGEVDRPALRNLGIDSCWRAGSR